MSSNIIYFVVNERYLPIAVSNAIFISRHISNADVCIFYEGKTPLSTRFINFGVKIYDRVLSDFLNIQVPENRKWPKIVYYRIFAPQIFEGRYSNALYLDADVSCSKDIDQIFTLDLGTTSLGAVHDMGMLSEKAPGLEIPTSQWLENLGLRRRRYFNSGVLYINIKRWLETDFNAKLRTYVAEYGSHMRMWDQDFLNYIFQDDWCELSPRWNFQYTLLGRGFEYFIRPSVYHYTYGVKPWDDKRKTYHEAHRLYFSNVLQAGGFGDVFGTQGRIYRELDLKLRSVLTALKYASPLYKRKLKRKCEGWREKNEVFTTFINHSLLNRRFVDVNRGLTPARLIDLKYAAGDLQFSGGRLISSKAMHIADEFIG